MVITERFKMFKMHFSKQPEVSISSNCQSLNRKSLNFIVHTNQIVEQAVNAEDPLFSLSFETETVSPKMINILELAD